MSAWMLMPFRAIHGEDRGNGASNLAGVGDGGGDGGCETYGYGGEYGAGFGSGSGCGYGDGFGNGLGYGCFVSQYYGQKRNVSGSELQKSGDRRY